MVKFIYDFIRTFSHQFPVTINLQVLFCLFMSSKPLNQTKQGKHWIPTSRKEIQVCFLYVGLATYPAAF